MEFRKLSLCMIVKNEEDCIGRCLSSVKGVVDEMIIVDTGSSDRTIDICRSFGAQVYDFPWTGSFSAARNYGLTWASGDWILWLDADEEVDAADATKLRDILYFDDENLLSLQLINYFGEEANPNNTFLISHPRLLRNHIGFKFVNDIHEMLNVDDVLGTYDTQSLKLVPIKLYHYGYLESATKTKSKRERNISMLKKELENEDHGPWIDYHIASEYYNEQKYDKSFEHVNRAIISFLQLGKTPPSLLYRLKYAILIGSGSIDGAWPGIEKAISLYPDYVDLHFFKGVILFVKESYKEALQAFDECLDIGEGNLHHLTLKGIGSFQAWYYKGLCFEQLGQIKEAAEAYVQSARLSPTFESAVDSLRKLIAKHRDVFGGTDESEDETLINSLLA